MNDILAAWKYADSVDEARRAALAKPGSFEEMVRFVSDDAREIRARVEPGRDRGLTDCVQPNLGEASRLGDGAQFAERLQKGLLLRARVRVYEPVR